MSTERHPWAEAAAGVRSARTKQGRLLSVGGKLARATIALVILVTVGIYLELSRYQREYVLQSKEVGAAALARPLADSCAAAVAFDDAAERNHRQVIDACGQRDRRIEAVAVERAERVQRLTKPRG